MALQRQCFLPIGEEGLSHAFEATPSVQSTHEWVALPS